MLLWALHLQEPWRNDADSAVGSFRSDFPDMSPEARTTVHAGLLNCTPGGTVALHH